jgi:chemotaxis protein MotB
MKKPASNSKELEQPKPRRRVKKVKHHGGHHGGAWKVAYADFVTAMMALFLVLWLVSQADTKLKESIANYFRSPGVFETMDGGILSAAKKVSKEPTNLASKDEEQALFSVAQSLQKKFEKRPEFSKFKDQVRVEVTEDGLRIQILDKAERVSFPVGSAELTDEAKIILAEIADTIKTLPNPIVIGGHTDGRPMQMANGYSNWELSADRANAARRFLETSGMNPKQIIRIIGYADSDLLVPDDPMAPSNRRITITIRKMASEAPATDKSADKPDGGKPEGESLQKPLSDEEKLMKTKLATEGTVTVGEPDAVPNVKRTKAE